MLRGAKKNMIVVRTRDSRVFEEAYFVMRRDKRPNPADEKDILWEANRILESSLPTAEQAKTSSKQTTAIPLLKNLFWYGAGLISGVGLGVLLCFVF